MNRQQSFRCPNKFRLFVFAPFTCRMPRYHSRLFTCWFFVICDQIGLVPFDEISNVIATIQTAALPRS